jgi:hypothetical protein
LTIPRHCPVPRLRPRQAASWPPAAARPDRAELVTNVALEHLDALARSYTRARPTTATCTQSRSGGARQGHLLDPCPPDRPRRDPHLSRGFRQEIRSNLRSAPGPEGRRLSSAGEDGCEAPRPCAIHGAARAAKRPDSTAPSPRSLIRMGWIRSQRESQDRGQTWSSRGLLSRCRGKPNQVIRTRGG